MKTTILARLGAVVVGLIGLVLLQVTNGYAARWGHTESESTSANVCADELGFFPAFLYTRIGLDKNGVFPGFEVYLSDKDGQCSALLYSSLATENAPSLSRIQSAEDQLFVVR